MSDYSADGRVAEHTFAEVEEEVRGHAGDETVAALAEFVILIHTMTS